jgi:isocitrate/isopropylmalate dehydrogenase
MMLDFLGEPAAATALDAAVLHVLAAQRDLTPDLGGTGSTDGITNAVVAQIERG